MNMFGQFVRLSHKHSKLRVTSGEHTHTHMWNQPTVPVNKSQRCLCSGSNDGEGVVSRPPWRSWNL